MKLSRGLIQGPVANSLQVGDGGSKASELMLGFKLSCSWLGGLNDLMPRSFFCMYLLEVRRACLLIIYTQLK
jgi:hypothetical protein